LCSYDLASLEILEQIGHVAQLLETQNAQLSGLMPTLLSAQHAFSPPVSSDLSNDHTNSLYPFIFNTIQYANDVLDHDEPRDEATLLSESLGFAETATIKCEDLFEWPVFEGKFHRSETENLIFNPDLAYEGQQMLDSCANSDLSRRSVLGRGIHEDDAPALIANFLANVHIKNPILNADDIIKMARDVTEHGFKWDAPSCLVVGSPKCGLFYHGVCTNRFLAHRMRFGLPIVTIHVRLYHTTIYAMYQCIQQYRRCDELL
jgi:hypothetical protein